MKSFLYFISMLPLLLATSVWADKAPYTQQEFDRLIKEGNPVLVEVHADWCSSCRVQANITDALLREKPYSHIQSLRLDYDKQKDALKRLRISKQSTLLIFKDGKEVSRILGDTSDEGIENLLKKVI